MRICAEKYCTTLTKNKYCAKHQKRLYRKRYPVKAAYQNLRWNARRRGKEFALTFGEFEQFCIRTKLLMGIGKTKESFSIDRINNDLGYTVDNIQVITLAENSRKKILDYDWMTRSARVRCLHEYASLDAPF